MSVINNLNTRQNPGPAGLTGTQVIKFIPGPRVYIKAEASYSSPAPVTTKSNGVAPSGWTDLGIVNGNVKITYTKNVKEVRTGIDQILRQTYIDKKTAQFEFALSQFDDAALSALSGLTASQIVAGSTYQYAIGAEDVVGTSLLLVLQNKLDGKEWQFYTPTANMTFDIADASGEVVLNGKGELLAFAWGGGSNEALMVGTIYA